MFANEIYISKTDKLQDYLGLNLEMNSSKVTWERAINIFINRIKGRYFNAIDKLSGNENPKDMFENGFSIMCLECLLIDTLVKFRYGPNRTRDTNYYSTKLVYDKYNNSFYKKLIYYKDNKVRFIRFLREFLICDPNSKKIAEKFYDDIRCSIMHFGSTENTSRLTCDSDKLITILENDDISVDIRVMNHVLKDYFNRYIEELRDNKQYDLRKNFLLAMDYLCGIYSKNIS